MALPSSKELRKEVERRLGAIQVLPLSGTYATSAKRYDFYEALAFAAIAEAGRRLGAGVSYKQPGKPAATEFHFRDQPGELWDGDYTYARLEFTPRDVFEVHLGVFAKGTSDIRHECDVLVLPQEQANRSRNQKRPPRAWRNCVAVECKFHARSSLPLGIGRAVLGLNGDLRWTGLRGGIWWPQADELRALTSMLVTPASNESVQKLLEHHSIAFADKVAAQNATSVGRLDQLATMSLGRCVWP